MSKSLMDVMLTRRSVRTYDGRCLNDNQIESIKKYINDESNFVSPFGSSVRIELLEHSNVDTRNVIKNAPVYVIVVIKNNRESLIDAGYIFEKFILFIESIGLSTCYLNSGFKRESVELKQSLKEGEVMVLASPIGYKAENKSLIEKGSRLFLKAGKRKEIDETFFSGFDRKIIEDKATREMLDYVRWAPSAKNKQPWRAILDDDVAHFYINGEEAREKRGDFNIHILDIGIALFHYSLVFDKSEFYKDDSIRCYDDMEYIVSVKR